MKLDKLNAKFSLLSKLLFTFFGINIGLIIFLFKGSQNDYHQLTWVALFLCLYAMIEVIGSILKTLEELNEVKHDE